MPSRLQKVRISKKQEHKSSTSFDQINDKGSEDREESKYTEKNRLTQSLSESAPSHVDVYIERRKELIHTTLHNVVVLDSLVRLICTYDDSWEYEAKVVVEGGLGSIIKRKLGREFGTNEMRNIRHLDLTSAALTPTGSPGKMYTLPEGLGLFKNLSKLVLRGNYLLSLPPDLGDLAPTLTHLNLARNKLGTIPPCVEVLTELEELILHSNELRSLSGLPHAKKLRTLIVSSNKIKGLPPGIARLDNLRTLVLSDNSISYIPQEICRLRSLHFLHLDGNRVKRLPQHFSSLKSLKRLLIDNNLLSDDSIVKLRQLGTFVSSAGMRVGV